MAIALAQAAVTASGTSLTTLPLTLGSGTTAGNCVIVCYACSGNTATPTISGVTLGGAAGNFAAAATSINDADFGIVAIWADPNCAGGQTAIAITTTGGSGGVGNGAVAFEFSGLVTTSVTDQTSALQNGTAATSWTSNATATTTVASELWVGVTGQSNSGTQPVITGPSSPWANTSVNGGSFSPWDVTVMAGYDIVSSTGAATYAGTVAPASFAGTLVVTFKGAGAVITAGPVISGAPVNTPVILAGRHGWQGAGHSR